ncbi:hypothetical protein yc1106_03248 [Curvularia clavata]|uniref:SGNH hydrolase-type esterase domain-containing protein n=1 Tax=Curvularia clavata TaxID=95742 RepID=A0A9Q8Z4S5_CURCL|nr:hypothetical protein yc1106_03248 [Curvularia clavata]
MPQFVLFGDSLTEWSFDEVDQGFGWFLQQKYRYKAAILNEGKAGGTSSDQKEAFNRIMQYTTAPGAPKTLLFTILLGTNDACYVGADREKVPLAEFSGNICGFLDTILTEMALEDAKIVLITPPPLNMPSPRSGKNMSQEEIEKDNASMRKSVWHMAYMNKRRYAEEVMKIAKEYEETQRVVGLNFWQNIVDAVVEEQVYEYNPGLPPGCGLHGAKTFPKGWFTDGLHLDVKGYAVLNKGLFKLITEKWPELAPENLLYG